MKPTKFDELLEYPCLFSFKAVGDARDDLPDLIVAEIQKYAPGDYTPQVKPSAKGTYHSVTVKVTVTSTEHVESIYKALSALDVVRMVL